MSIKALLTRILNRVNFRTVTGTSASTTIAGGSTAWISVPYPTSGKTIGINGYYMNGNSYCLPYAIQMGASTAYAAVRNTGTGSATLTVDFYFLVVD